jgi:hypothetical protein
MSNRRITHQNVVHDGNRYCGPLVIAALLGCTTAEAAAKVRLATNIDGAIKGMRNADMVKTLERVGGYTLTPMAFPMRYIEQRRIGQPGGQLQFATNAWTLNVPGGIRLWRPPSEGLHASPYTKVRRVGCTLAAWLRFRADKSATYVVNTTGHYVLVVGRKFVDTGTRGEWVGIGKAPRRRSRVENVWQVTR